MRKILVTGGAGYIGSHTVIELHNAGYDPIIVDDFSNSEKQILNGIDQILGKKVKVYEGDCKDRRFIQQIVIEENVAHDHNDLDGLPIEDWQEVRTVWADIRPFDDTRSYGEEYREGDQMVGKTTHRIWTRHGTYSSAWRIRHNDDIYEIESVAEHLGRGYFLEWRCLKRA